MEMLYDTITMTEMMTNTEEGKVILGRESLVKEMPKQKQEGLGMVAFFFLCSYGLYLSKDQPFDQLAVL